MGVIVRTAGIGRTLKNCNGILIICLQPVTTPEVTIQSTAFCSRKQCHVRAIRDYLRQCR